MEVVVSEGEKCFRQLALVIAEPVWVVGADGRLAYGNPRWHTLTAIAAGTDFPGAYLGFIHPEDRQRWLGTWEHALRTRSSYAIERRARFAPDAPYTRQVEHAQPVRDASGAVVEWMLTATTLEDDDCQHLIEGLRHSLVRQNEALIEVAHEMRTPLAPIATAVQLLERRGGDPAFVADVRAVIDRQVRQLMRLVEDLLDVGRIEQRQLGVRKERIDLRGVVTAAIETAQPIVNARGHELTMTVLADAAIVEGDAGRLTQVLVNLLVNAAKFTDDGGRISISLARENASFVVKVRDTGIGIASEMLPRIFDAYVRVERGSASGLGLGLALAQELVQLHAGSLSAHSEGVGKGSEFVLTLPTVAC